MPGQAGEFVREEMHHIREGKHGARNTKQAIAIGLSKARRGRKSWVPPRKGKASSQVRQKAERDLRRGKHRSTKRASKTRSRAISGVLKGESHSAASKKSLSRQARSSARTRGAASRHQAAMKAVRTKGKRGLSQAAKKAARTRARSA